MLLVKILRKRSVLEVMLSMISIGIITMPIMKTDLLPNIKIFSITAIITKRNVNDFDEIQI